MSIKSRFTLIFSCLFSVLLATVMLTVYFLFAQFRQDEFVDRLSEKAETTIKLLVKVKEVDYKLQKIIDSNSVNRLYHEKVLIFNDRRHIIYNSTNDSTVIEWNLQDLNHIRANHKLLKTSRQYDVLGLYFDFDDRDYYVLISAEDTYGNRKLNYLKYLLLGAFTVGTTAVWLISFSLSRKSLEPLDVVRKQIQEITDRNLNIRLRQGRRADEINALAYSFNQMMDRIDDAYHRQKNFTGNASHELRTPVARIAAQVENLLHTNNLSSEVRLHLNSVAEDVFQLSEIISSLIALSEINHDQHMVSFQKIRLDEIIFDVAAETTNHFPGCKIKFEIENHTDQETDVEVAGDETLLKIVFRNLFKNACLYSDNQVIDCLLKQTATTTEVTIANTGEPPNVQDASVLFNTFYRGTNAQNKTGSGIGLSIVRRVLQRHQATVEFRIQGRYCQVVAAFPKN